MSPDITFVCWGNICRSPMAEVIAREHAEREGLHGVTFSSAGVSAERPATRSIPALQRR